MLASGKLIIIHCYKLLIINLLIKLFIYLILGKLPADALPGSLALESCVLGLEFAGRDSNGKRIMGMVASKGLATDVVLNNETDFVYPVPDNWTLEQAATVPVAYATAYYALVVRGGKIFLKL